MATKRKTKTLTLGEAFSQARDNPDGEAARLIQNHFCKIEEHFNNNAAKWAEIAAAIEAPLKSFSSRWAEVADNVERFAEMAIRAGEMLCSFETVCSLLERDSMMRLKRLGFATEYEARKSLLEGGEEVKPKAREQIETHLSVLDRCRNVRDRYDETLKDKSNGNIEKLARDCVRFGYFAAVPLLLDYKEKQDAWRSKGAPKAAKTRKENADERNEKIRSMAREFFAVNPLASYDEAASFLRPRCGWKRTDGWLKKIISGTDKEAVATLAKKAKR
ncbi:MAG: hypothetical protein LBE75_02960 [Burkholderiales bacterium]|nr:hypothetical protein [Burkholderiales bacterium]